MPNARRRVTIKARLVNLAKARPRSTVTHLRYIEREGMDRQGGRAMPTARQRMRRTLLLSRNMGAHGGRPRYAAERQTRVIGATWLDQQLIGGGKVLGDLGFGSEVKDVLQQRVDFLTEQGLAGSSNYYGIALC